MKEERHGLRLRRPRYFLLCCHQLIIDHWGLGICISPPPSRGMTGLAGKDLGSGPGVTVFLGLF